MNELEIQVEGALLRHGLSRNRMAVYRALQESPTSLEDSQIYGHITSRYGANLTRSAVNQLIRSPKESRIESTPPQGRKKTRYHCLSEAATHELASIVPEDNLPYLDVLLKVMFRHDLTRFAVPLFRILDAHPGSRIVEIIGHFKAIYGYKILRRNINYTIDHNTERVEKTQIKGGVSCTNLQPAIDILQELSQPA